MSFVPDRAPSPPRMGSRRAGIRREGESGCRRRRRSQAAFPPASSGVPPALESVPPAPPRPPRAHLALPALTWASRRRQTFGCGLVIAERARLVDEHDRDAVADRVGQPRLLADQLLGFAIVA